MKELPLGAGVSVFCDSVHRFSTDSILLADFAHPGRSDIALDLCTGCGIIPLLWCRKPSPARITAVDIQPAAIMLLQKSVEQNGLGQRIFPVCSDLNDLSNFIVRDGFSLLTVNPPYFVRGSGKPSRNPAVSAVRQEDLCTMRQIASAASKLLRSQGRICLCQRPERLAETISELAQCGLQVKRLCFVRYKSGAIPRLFLLEAVLGAQSGMTLSETLTLTNPDGSYTAEALAIYGEYYHEKEVEK